MSWNTAGAIASLGGAVLGLLGQATKTQGQVASLQAAQTVANYRATVARNNAQTLDTEAEYADRAGLANAGLESQKGAYIQGALKAKQGANNVLVNKGSNVAVRAGAAEASKLDTERTMANADLTAWGLRNRANNMRADAELLSAEGRNAGAAIGPTEEAGLFSGAGMLLSNVSTLPTKFNLGKGDDQTISGQNTSGNDTLTPTGDAVTYGTA
jgi:hypothetical protein